MRTLNQNSLNSEQRASYESMMNSPITILQIGEGNFLRGFFDWMIQQCRKQGLYNGSVAVIQPREHGKEKIDAIAAQDNLYTLVIRGLENGESVERKEVISVFQQAFDPYSSWEQFLEQAANPDLKFIISNTTEAGLVYRPEPLIEGQPVNSYPGKLTKLLYERFVHFNGAPERGVICLPCELLERNGDDLKKYVLQFSDDWGYPESFKQWISEHNRFLNSLVDRIVTGYPDAIQAEAWFSEWGYSDTQLTTAEPYHLWAIEAEPELDKLLPLQQAGLNVHWTTDLKAFQQRKVRILNGAHTLMTPLAIVQGFEHVRETMEDDRLGRFVRRTIESEIIPTLPYDAKELNDYANTVYERFLNPFIRHRLADIAMNSLSKFKTRLLPSALHYIENGKPLPDGLTQGLAGLLRYYKVTKAEQGYEGKTLSGASYIVRDDAGMLEQIAAIWQLAAEHRHNYDTTVTELLSLESIWGQNLNATCPELASAIADHMMRLESAANEQLG